MEITIDQHTYTDLNKIPKITRQLLRCAIIAQVPNRVYQAIHHQGHQIKFKEPIYIRSSQKRLGERKLFIRKAQVGKGAYSVVSEFERVFYDSDKNHQSNSTWVIKQIKDYQERSKVEKSEFELESRYLQLLYPNIQFDQETGCIMMPKFGSQFYDYDDGTSGVFGSSYVKSKHFSQRAYYAEMFLKSLARLHKHDIVHLDIKPENICFKVSNDGLEEMNIIDLTFSQKEGTLHQPCGTPDYMSPEQQMRNFIVRKHSDIFVASRVVLEILFGIDAFDESRYLQGINAEIFENIYCYISYEDLLVFKTNDCALIKKKLAEISNQANIAREKIKKYCKDDEQFDYYQDAIKLYDVMLNLAKKCEKGTEFLERLPAAYAKTLEKDSELRYVNELFNDKLLAQAMTKDLSKYLKANKKIIPQQYHSLIVYLFKNSYRLDATQRFSLMQMIFVVRLLQLNERQINYLKYNSKTKARKVILTPEEKIHLRVLLCQSRQNPMYAAALASLSRNLRNTKTIAGKAQSLTRKLNIDSFVYEGLQSPSLEKLFFQVIHANSLGALGITVNIESLKEVIAKYPEVFLSQYKSIQNKIIQVSSRCGKKFGFDYALDDIHQKLHESAFSALTQLEKRDRSLSIRYFHQLPSHTKNYFREHHASSHLVPYLNGFHQNIRTKAEAEALLLQNNVSNQFLLYQENEDFFMMRWMSSRRGKPIFQHAHIDVLKQDVSKSPSVCVVPLMNVKSDTPLYHLNYRDFYHKPFRDTKDFLEPIQENAFYENLCDNLLDFDKNLCSQQIAAYPKFIREHILTLLKQRSLRSHNLDETINLSAAISQIKSYNEKDNQKDSFVTSILGKRNYSSFFSNFQEHTTSDSDPTLGGMLASLWNFK